MKISIPELLVLGVTFVFCVWFIVTKIAADLPPDLFKKKRGK